MVPVTKKNHPTAERTPVTTIQAPPLDGAFAAPAAAPQLERAAEALSGNGFTVHVADTAADARELVAGLLPTDKEVFTASSETLRLSGISADIDESGKYRSVRAQ